MGKVVRVLLATHSRWIDQLSAGQHRESAAVFVVSEGPDFHLELLRTLSVAAYHGAGREFWNSNAEPTASISFLVASLADRPLVGTRRYFVQGLPQIADGQTFEYATVTENGPFNWSSESSVVLGPCTIHKEWKTGAARFFAKVNGGQALVDQWYASSACASVASAVCKTAQQRLSRLRDHAWNYNER